MSALNDKAQDGFNRLRKERGGSAETMELPKSAMPGDRMRLTIETEVETKKAYPDAAPWKTRTVVQFEPYTNGFLRLDGPPFIVEQKQILLDWKDDAERRAGLKAFHAKAR